jgi:hypothetical protein
VYVRFASRALLSIAVTGMLVGLGATPASANSDTTSNQPLTCTTNPNVGNQAAAWNSTVSDDHDPAAVGDTVTYTFVVPFKEAATPVSATYKGGKTYYNIPAGLSVTSVSVAPVSGSQIHGTAAVSGSQIVVTSTANVPVDGTTYTTDNLVVKGTVTAAAAGPGVNWAIPPKVIATVFVNGIGNITATCTPNTPSTIIAKTTVPGAPSGPTATDKTLSVSAGTPTKITLTGTSPKGYSLTTSVVTQPAHGTLTGTAPTVTYTSAAGFTGTDSFTFKVDDGHGGSAIGTVTLNVKAGPIIDRTPPVVTLTSPAHGAVYSPTDTVTAAYTCADTTTSVASCTGTAANGAAVNLAVGVHTFVVTAVDAQGNKAQKLVSYRVIDPTPVAQHYTGSGADTLAITCDNTLLTPTTLPLTVSAPTQVPVGGSFSMIAAPGEQSVPQLLEYTNLQYTVAAPAGATITGASVVPNTGTPAAQAGATASVSSGTAVLTVPGPIDGGQTAATNFTAPRMLVTMTASGGAATTATTKFASFVFTRGVAGVPNPPPPAPPATQTVTCPVTAPTPTLTSTAILDVTPPTVTLTAPAHGAIYKVGQKVVAKFACADAVALASCKATLVNGATVPTTKAGKYTFVVDAIDKAGNHSQAYASYNVV